jgi:general secretion pathway protein B
MSLILDALKRAERERNADAVPAPGEVSVPAAGRARPRRRWWIAVTIVAVAVGTVLGWKAWRGKPARVAPPMVTQTPPAPPVIVARPAPPPAPLPAPSPAVVPGTEAVASLDDLTDEPILEAVPAPPGDAAAAAVTPAPAPAPVPAKPEAQAPEPTPSEPSAAPAEPAAAPAEIPPALTQPAPLRKFREMPPDYRADFPALKIEIHVYEKARAQRFVMINGRKYREGERLSEGPQLVEIVPEGIVLEYRGEKVLYTLGR